MAMAAYEVLCYAQNCGQPAVYKIAAKWSDGLTGELKTYALACPRCLPALFRASRSRQAACRIAPGEVLETPGIYFLERGQHDQELRRAADFERELSSATANATSPQGGSP
jgi:hypothetical protein